MYRNHVGVCPFAPGAYEVVYSTRGMEYLQKRKQKQYLQKKKKARVKNNSFKSIILAKKIARVIFISNWKILAKKKARETVL